MRHRRSWIGGALAALALASCAPGPTEPDKEDRPEVHSISPSQGSVLGGASVTIRGRAFSQPLSVTIGGRPAIGVTLESREAISARTPAAIGPGSVAVAVTTGVGTASLNGAYLYVTPEPNAPPIIESIVTRSSNSTRPLDLAELGERIEVSATVTDADTPASALIFQWSSTAGTIAGNGPTATWQAPSPSETPLKVQLTLKVIDRYGESAASQHEVEASHSMWVHDSSSELAMMSRRFLLEFSTPQFNRDWRNIMRDFDLNGSVCPDPGLVEAERDEVINHYTNFVMHDFSIGTAKVNVKFGSRCDVRDRAGDACIAVPVLWDSTDTRTATRKVTTGVDHLSAVYSRHEHRWRLCSSDFPPEGGATPEGHPFYWR